MLKYILGILLIFIGRFASFAQEKIIIKSNLGYIQGLKEGLSYVFKGVPYAENLTFKTRFDPPKSKQPWKDTLSAFQFGNSAPQYGNKNDTVKGNEDCLFLNIYSPRNLKAMKPVVIWVHGGSMIAGAGSGMDGHAFSDNDNIVTVTINYRLGAFGFLYLGDIQQKYSGNNGLLDLIMALRFIKNNIQNFGGNPDQITVMGESAGAKLVSTLLLTKKSNNLFHQLILESGAIQCARDITTAKAIRQRLLDTLKLNSAKELLNLSTAQIIDAQNKVCGGAKGTNYFGPVADNIIIPTNYVAFLKKRNLNKIRVLLGSNKAESRLFMKMDKRLYSPNQSVLEDWFGINGIEINSKISKAPKDSTSNLLTEYMYAMHTHRLANILKSKKIPTWLYRFDYSKDSMGATHADELKYVWYNNKSNVPNDSLAINVHQQWVNFIQHKSPSSVWKNYSIFNTMQIFGTTIHQQQNPVFYEDNAIPTSCFILTNKSSEYNHSTK